MGSQGKSMHGAGEFSWHQQGCRTLVPPEVWGDRLIGVSSQQAGRGPTGERNYRQLFKDWDAKGRRKGMAPGREVELREGGFCFF